MAAGRNVLELHADCNDPDSGPGLDSADRSACRFIRAAFSRAKFPGGHFYRAGIIQASNRASNRASVSHLAPLEVLPGIRSFGDLSLGSIAVGSRGRANDALRRVFDGDCGTHTGSFGSFPISDYARANGKSAWAPVRSLRRMAA